MQNGHYLAIGWWQGLWSRIRRTGALQPYGAVTEAVTETYSVARVSVDTSVTERPTAP